MEKGVATINDFIEYFQSQWIDSAFSGWYESYASGLPSHTNALESTNEKIKTNFTFRERKSISEFKNTVEKMIQLWSKARDPLAVDSKSFSEKPLVNLSSQTAAHQWLLKKKDVIKVRVGRSPSIYLHYIPSGKKTTLTREEVDIFMALHNNCSWSPFAEFSHHESSIWCVTLNETDWLKGECTCPFHKKNYFCKHVIGLSARMRYCEIPLIAQNVPVGERRKRGRVSRSRQALLVQ